MSAEKLFESLSEFQQLYHINRLRLRHPKWEQQGTNQALIEAKIDAIPHQVDAAMFAFRNPIAGGVILADEVGLGKTIETGLILSQMWAEGKRSFLIVSPKSLRHQWREELKNLFDLKAEIVDTSIYKKIESGNLRDPFKADAKIVVTNEHFVEKYPEAVRQGQWDLVIIDEAHKLRNVWKAGKNDAKRAKAIRRTIEPYRKLLLTATPIQNNLMELFGLVSFIDPLVLGSAESFQRLFKNIPEEIQEERLADLRSRMSRFFKRELRKNVLTYIQYTVRNPITITYNPSDEEEELRERFEEYLRSTDSLAIPASASHLLRLVYLKLLASSSFALKSSLLNLYKRLMLHSVFIKRKDVFEKLESMIRSALTLDGGRKAHELELFEKKLYKGVRKKNFDGLAAELHKASLLEDLAEDESEIPLNYEDEAIDEASTDEESKVDPGKLLHEASLILEFIVLSRKISENKKAKALISTLTKQFEKARNEGWPEKAVIFTEFRATQDYVLTALESMGINLETEVVIFNGSSGDAESRKKLVDEFRSTKKIFLATEAGAEGLNLQFCNLIVNYDLPWNPQRIEQRIGRCHRYGQKLDVVVVNFVNEKNIADKRVLELLQEKFSLFRGAFGASDEVLGLIESGTDFEREIMKIYLTCRSPEEIQRAFDRLMNDNREFVDQKMTELKQNILNTFDEEVQRKLKVLHEKTVHEIGAVQRCVRDIVLSAGGATLIFDGKVVRSDSGKFGLDGNRTYTFDRMASGKELELLHAHSTTLDEIARILPSKGHVDFLYSGRHNIALVAPLVGTSGRFAVYKVNLSGIDQKELLIPIFCDHNGMIMDNEVAMKIAGISSAVKSVYDGTTIENVTDALNHAIQDSVAEFNQYHEALYDEEIEKVERYFDDLQELKKFEIDDVQKEIEVLKKERNSLPFAAKKDINAKIQKLKDKQAAIEDEIVEYRRKARDEEKSRTKNLHDQGDVSVSWSEVFSGTFKII